MNNKKIFLILIIVFASITGLLLIQNRNLKNKTRIETVVFQNKNIAESERVDADIQFSMRISRKEIKEQKDAFFDTKHYLIHGFINGDRNQPVTVELGEETQRIRIRYLESKDSNKRVSDSLSLEEGFGKIDEQTLVTIHLEFYNHDEIENYILNTLEQKEWSEPLFITNLVLRMIEAV